ncbi:hypothetical protein [Streptomyces sp. NPDC006309]|uniref:hypothetical protein n=1 Tax=Streptomyces sp. NPDC006309 TaxID=3156749 RepID=UPI0033B3D124
MALGAGTRWSQRRSRRDSYPREHRFFAYIAAVVAVLIASMVVGHEDGHADYFRADKAWLYIVILTVGCMISRGLAKSGSRDPYDESR